MADQWTKAGIARLGGVMDRHVETGSAVGLAWAVVRHGEVATGASGTTDAQLDHAVDDRTIFRISSMTKPVTAVAALVLVEDCVLRLDEPVDRFLPELADRTRPGRPAGPLDATVPAERPITLRDLLTFRMGLGMDFTFSYPQAGLQRMAELGLGRGPARPGSVACARRVDATARHDPARAPARDALAVPHECGRARRADRPGRRPALEHVPARADLRAAGDARHRVLGAGRGPRPLRAGLRFRSRHRARPWWIRADGEWSSPPAFPGRWRGPGLDAGRLPRVRVDALGRGTHAGVRILSRPSVELMTTNQLTAGSGRRRVPAPTATRVGWGFGVSVQLQRTDIRSVGTYGWDGGYGTVWANDPAEDLVGVHAHQPDVDVAPATAGGRRLLDRHLRRDRSMTMGKIVVTEFVSLDGVMEAPGANRGTSTRTGCVGIPMPVSSTTSSPSCSSTRRC